MTSFSAVGDQATDEMLTACVRSKGCDGDHATKVMIIVMVTWVVVMVAFGVGVWMLMHKSRHRPNEWPIYRWRRKEEERRAWWEHACDGWRSGLSKDKAVL